MTLRQERLPIARSCSPCLIVYNFAFGDIDEFYHVARLCLVKDETLDKFDRAFSKYFEQLDLIDDLSLYQIPEQWLKKQFENSLSDEEKAQIEAMGGLEKLLKPSQAMEGRRKGTRGNKWIGTGGVPFGAYGYNPEGIRIGQDEGRNSRAVKVWIGAITATLMIRLRSGHAISKWHWRRHASSQERGR